MVLMTRTRDPIAVGRDDHRREFDRLFEWLVPEPRTGGTATWVPPVDVTETDEEIRYSIEVPGVRPDDLSVTIENDVLTIAGERRRGHTDSDDVDRARRRFERRVGRFERSISLPATVEPDEGRARCGHGILEIVLPKSEAAKPRRIPIEPAGDTRAIEGADDG